MPPGRFTFLCMFDFSSVMQRKNPLGAVEAFRRAFPNASNAALLIKTSHARRIAASTPSSQAAFAGFRTST